MFLDEANDNNHAPDEERADLHAACSILRLSTKYIMPKIRDRSIKQLERHIPITFDKFENHPCNKASKNYQQCSTLVRVINVARETGVHWVLPMAFYRLSQINPDKSFSDIYTQLSQEDMGTWMHGREVLLEAMLSLGPSEFSTPERCIDATGKDAAFLRILQQKMMGPTSNFKRSVLFNINIRQSFPTRCEFCIEDLSTRFSTRRKEGWEKLPGWFGLPSWAELLEARANRNSG